MEGYKLSAEMVKAVRAVIREYQNGSQHPSAKKGFKRERVQQEDIVQVKCTVAIPAATDSFATPSTSGKAKFQVSDSSGVLSDYSPEIEVEVINHSESDSWAVNDYLKIHFIDGKWHPYTGKSSGGTCCQVTAAEEELDYVFQGVPISGARIWSNECDGGALPNYRIYFEGTADASLPGKDGDVNQYRCNRNEGYVEWQPTASTRLVWDLEQSKYIRDISSEIKVYNSSDVDITGSIVGTISGEIVEYVDDKWLSINIDVPSPGGSVPAIDAAFWYGDVAYSSYQSKTRSGVFYLYEWLTRWQREPGTFMICTKPDQETIDVSGNVNMWVEVVINSQTDTAVTGTNGYVDVDFDVKLVVENDTTEAVTLNYDAEDIIYDSIGIGTYSADFPVTRGAWDAAKTLNVTAGTTGKLTILSGYTRALMYGGTGQLPAAPDEVNVAFTVYQSITGDTTSNEYYGGAYTSGGRYVTYSFTLKKGTSGIYSDYHGGGTIGPYGL